MMLMIAAVLALWPADDACPGVRLWGIRVSDGSFMALGWKLVLVLMEC